MLLNPVFAKKFLSFRKKSKLNHCLRFVMMQCRSMQTDITLSKLKSCIFHDYADFCGTFFMLLINNSFNLYFMTHQLWYLLKMSQTNII